MPRRTAVRPIGLTLACAVAISLTVPALAGAKPKTVGAELRVVGPDGQTLSQQVQYTGTVRVPTDPDALCFGQGSGGSGARVKLSGPTALGAVKDASETDRDLRPLSLTDAFDFGLGVCGIGGFQAQGPGSWYLKHNHAGAQVGGDQLAVKTGEEVLWYLAPSFPYPLELALEAPARVDPGESFEVRVLAYAEDGTATPATGARVGGATTGADGRATLQLDSAERLQARRGTDIPSNEAMVCVTPVSECGYQQMIAGTAKPDKVRGTKLADEIKARGRNDRVKARGGAADRINCGTGKRDVAIVDSDDTTKACEKVKRK